MSVIKLRQDDLIVRRAIGLDTNALTEVGFIPGDEFGCKIYARNKEGLLSFIGIHSRSYGCYADPQTDGVEIVPVPVKRCLVD